MGSGPMGTSMPGNSTASAVGGYGRKVASALQPLERAANSRVSGQSGGSDRTQQAAASAQSQVSNLRVLGSMKKGGRVKKTGVYRLHAGESVKPARKKAKREKKRGRGR